MPRVDRTLRDGTSLLRGRTGNTHTGNHQWRRWQKSGFERFNICMQELSQKLVIRAASVINDDTRRTITRCQHGTYCAQLADMWKQSQIYSIQTGDKILLTCNKFNTHEATSWLIRQ